MIDFTNCSIVPGRAYNGANGSKIAVSYHNEVYMLKFPPSADKSLRNYHIPMAVSASILPAVFSIWLGLKLRKQFLEPIQ